jgi:hypothetical protein
MIHNYPIHNRMSSSDLFPKCMGLTALEWHYVETYAGNLYEPLNLFLIDADTIQTYRRIYKQEFAQNLYYLITNTHNSYVNGIIPHNKEKSVLRLIQSKSSNIEWFRNIMFRFTIMLYGIILKCPRLHQEVDVYRGVLTHYLNEDPTRGMFLTTFTSTSMTPQIARGFSKNDENSVIIYHFRVMPGVSCIYIGTTEDELLINPYQHYHFIRNMDNHYYYMIRPLSIDPPQNEHAFSDFKKEMMIRTVEMEGGRTQNKELTHSITVADHRNTYKNNRKNKNTRKNKKPKKLSAREHFYARMRMPIGSSSISFPISEDARKDIEKYNKELDERFKNNTYY